MSAPRGRPIANLIARGMSRGRPPPPRRGSAGPAAPRYEATARGTSGGSRRIGPPAVLVLTPVPAPAAVGDDPMRTGPPPPRAGPSNSAGSTDGELEGLAGRLPAITDGGRHEQRPGEARV